jgi:hypothetical protein
MKHSSPRGTFITAQDEDSPWKRASMIPNIVYLHKPFVGTGAA